MNVAPYDYELLANINDQSLLLSSAYIIHKVKEKEIV